MAHPAESDCPLCAEEMDATDRNFRPCPCGFQICLWCYHRVLQEGDKKCPICRQEYDGKGETINAELSSSDLKDGGAPKVERQGRTRSRDRAGKRGSSRSASSGNRSQSRGASAAATGQAPNRRAANASASRKHLANVRVIQRDLIYVIGLAPSIAHEEVLRKAEFFGQYGPIRKCVVNRARPHTVGGKPPSLSAYITFQDREDAAAAVAAADGFRVDGRIIHASYGTTKYCSYFLRHQRCPNPECLYLHHMGSGEDSFTKDEMLRTSRATFHGKLQPKRPQRARQRVSNAVLPQPEGCEDPSSQSRSRSHEPSLAPPASTPDIPPAHGGRPALRRARTEASPAPAPKPGPAPGAALPPVPPSGASRAAHSPNPGSWAEAARIAAGGPTPADARPSPPRADLDADPELSAAAVPRAAAAHSTVVEQAPEPAAGSEPVESGFASSLFSQVPQLEPQLPPQAGTEPSTVAALQGSLPDPGFEASAADVPLTAPTAFDVMAHGVSEPQPHSAQQDALMPGAVPGSGYGADAPGAHHSPLYSAGATHPAYAAAHAEQATWSQDALGQSAWDGSSAPTGWPQPAQPEAGSAFGHEGMPAPPGFYQGAPQQQHQHHHQQHHQQQHGMQGGPWGDASPWAAFSAPGMAGWDVGGPAAASAAYGPSHAAHDPAASATWAPAFHAPSSQGWPATHAGYEAQQGAPPSQGSLGAPPGIPVVAPSMVQGGYPPQHYAPAGGPPPQQQHSAPFGGFGGGGGIEAMLAPAAGGGDVSAASPFPRQGGPGSGATPPPPGFGAPAAAAAGGGGGGGGNEAQRDSGDGDGLDLLRSMLPDVNITVDGDSRGEEQAGLWFQPSSSPVFSSAADAQVWAGAAASEADRTWEETLQDAQEGTWPRDEGPAQAAAEAVPGSGADQGGGGQRGKAGKGAKQRQKQQAKPKQKRKEQQPQQPQQPQPQKQQQQQQPNGAGEQDEAGSEAGAGTSKSQRARRRRRGARKK